MARSSRALAVLLLAGCAEYYYLDLPNIDLEAPVDLEQRRAACKEGREKWHSDPRAVADMAIRHYVDVPWKADPYRAHLYEVGEKPEWGTFVTRGYTYPSGGVMRYRVKVRPYKEIWYPVQISRYKVVERPEDHAHSH